jgi:hypothetical protein
MTFAPRDHPTNARDQYRNTNGHPSLQKNASVFTRDLMPSTALRPRCPPSSTADTLTDLLNATAHLNRSHMRRDQI